MTARSDGIWLLQNFIAEHFENGMYALYQVSDPKGLITCPDNSLPQKCHHDPCSLITCKNSGNKCHKNSCHACRATCACAQSPFLVSVSSNGHSSTNNSTVQDVPYALACNILIDLF